MGGRICTALVGNKEAGDAHTSNTWLNDATLRNARSRGARKSYGWKILTGDRRDADSIGSERFAVCIVVRYCWLIKRRSPESLKWDLDWARLRRWRDESEECTVEPAASRPCGIAVLSITRREPSARNPSPI